MHQNIGKYVQNKVDAHADTLAFQIRRGYRIEKYTYREMFDLSRKFSTFLHDQKVKQGDNILIWGPNMPEWGLALLGAVFSGIVVVPVSVHASQETVDEYISQTKAKVLVKSKFIEISPKQKIKEIVLEDLVDLVAGLEPSPIAKTKLDDVAEIMYTSGTTGDPSGVMLTHRNILTGIEGLKILIPPSREYRFLSILPLSHALEQLVGLFTIFHFGATIYYIPKVNAVTIAKSMRKYEITHLVVVPQLLKVMWDSIEIKVEEQGRSKTFSQAFTIAKYLPFWLRRLLFNEIHRNLGGKLKMIGTAGAPLDVDVGTSWERLGVVVLEGYGLTETSAGLSANTISTRKIGSVGKIMPGVDVKFTEDGEILTRGANITPGYFKNPTKTKDSFTKNGYFKTGDIGYLDEDGFLFLSGRKKFKIVTPTGEKVYPEDVERVINHVPGVKESCVVGIDKGKGEVVFAAVILKKGTKAEDVISKANSQLESHQTILEYAEWEEDDFPRTRSLKKNRNAVRSWAMRRLGIDTEGGEELVSGETASVSEDKLVRILASICSVEEKSISDESKLVYDLDLDSLKRVALVSIIEDEYGIEIPEEKIDETTTVKSLRLLIKDSPRISLAPTHVSWPNNRIVVEIREIARRLFFPLARIIGPHRVEVSGIENIEGLDLPAMMIFNHVGHNEPMFILKALPSKIRKQQVTLADPRSFRNKMRAFFMYFFGSAFPIQKFGGPIRHSLELAADLLDQGKLLFYSPEGIRSESDKMGEFKLGAGVLAVETGVPVYPVKVKGYQNVYPKQGKDFDIPRRKGTVSLHFGPSIRFEKDISYEEATARMRDVLESM